MNNKCKIIQDILPLYVENIICEETKAFVEDHLEGCDDCRRLLINMKEPSEIPVKISSAPLKYLKKKLVNKRIATIVFTSAIVLTIVMIGVAFLTSPQYLPYTNGLLSLTETGNGTITGSFSSEVTGYNIWSTNDGRTSIYYIDAWNTVWDEYFAKHGSQNFIIEFIDGEAIEIYYSMNGTAEDILIYSTGHYMESGGVWTLPRLVLGYNMKIATIATIILAVLLFLFHKKTAVKLWIERFLLLPVSYIAAHLCILGFSSATYSLQHDFLFILLVTIPIYLACLLGIRLIRARKEGRGEQ